MDEEEIENDRANARLIKNVLGLEFDEYERYQENAFNGLLKFGNDFEIRLGELLFISSIPNAVRILHMWKNECSQYAMLWRIHKARETAEAGVR